MGSFQREREREIERVKVAFGATLTKNCPRLTAANRTNAFEVKRVSACS